MYVSTLAEISLNSLALRGCITNCTFVDDFSLAFVRILKMPSETLRVCAEAPFGERITKENELRECFSGCSATHPVNTGYKQL